MDLVLIHFGIKVIKWKIQLSLSKNYRNGAVYGTNSFYNTFIAINAIHEINISSDCRSEWINFFDNKEKEDDIIDDELEQNIIKYLEIFNNAIEEIYGVLVSVYRFQFKSEKRFSS